MGEHLDFEDFEKCGKGIRFFQNPVPFRAATADKKSRTIETLSGQIRRFSNVHHLLRPPDLANFPNRPGPPGLRREIRRVCVSIVSRVAAGHAMSIFVRVRGWNKSWAASLLRRIRSGPFRPLKKFTGYHGVSFRYRRSWRHPPKGCGNRGKRENFCGRRANLPGPNWKIELETHYPAISQNL